MSYFRCDTAWTWGVAVLLAALPLGCQQPSQQGPAAAGANATPSVGGPPRLTVLLAQYDDNDQVRRAEALQRRAQQLLGKYPIWLEHNSLGLAVNYGRFQSYSQARAVWQQVRKYYARLDAGQFQFCYVREIPQPDPPAPAEWNLLNSSCRYALEIGAYRDVPEQNYYERKADAVKGVRALRESGQTAFFVHGHGESRIYVGCFPASISLGGNVPAAQLMQHPLLQLLLKRYPCRYENGAKVYLVIRDAQGNQVRIPRQPVLIDVALLRRNIGF